MAGFKQRNFVIGSDRSASSPRTTAHNPVKHSHLGDSYIHEPSHQPTAFRFPSFSLMTIKARNRQVQGKV